MCGRMAMTLPHEAMVELFAATPANDLPEVPNYNVCPTVQIPVVTAEAGLRQYRPMRWGFIPKWYKKPNGGPLLINARAETIAEKPAFREACRARRCLVPCTGFYEWERDSDDKPLPWFVARSDGAPLVMAGIWQDWERDGERLTTCAVVTTEANDAMARIHHRIPVILTPDQWALWLGETGKGASTIMHAPPEDALHFDRVSTDVNSNRAKGAALIEPLAE
ncbi:SOS response-associated peptidase [Yoonia sp. 208BN28-4]|uniref:SOS response-associated peptidase n=1 Tax=Yoonia sp. 208BN28-4 TaxID=3126505 RepID=UPI0030A41F3D